MMMWDFPRQLFYMQDGHTSLKALPKNVTYFEALESACKLLICLKVLE